ncbi:PepSY domain-containing protein [Chitinophaga varians]|uniref:PepSY domain-containing protein n=1 Tax=Chitinophaga varians TaxID=2202339 RepID=UPI00165F1FD7|nr:PepSY domain-containing protein [Chitinophaga varians]MBC9914504.1 PepSY domain-containing protein [Chitinophaga varians]
MAKSKHYYIRKSHRYLGLFLGIQFLLWTIGGLYFSWSNMDDVHGDLQKKAAPPLAFKGKLVSPSVAFENIDSFASVQLIQILGHPYYQIKTADKKHLAAGHEHTAHQQTYLADAYTGQLRSPLTEEEAVEVAKDRFNGAPTVKQVEYLTATGGHHEYRESALPAYAVTFDHPSGTTVYVSTELGTVQKFRNSKWRAFDFLWMLHTMDYESRDNIGNLLLRIFSILGLITVISGFLLYGISSRLFKKRKKVRLAARP